MSAAPPELRAVVLGYHGRRYLSYRLGTALKDLITLCENKNNGDHSGEIPLLHAYQALALYDDS